MFNIRSFVIVAIAALISIPTATAAVKNVEQSKNQVTTFPVADVIAQVKRELLAVANTPGASVGLALEKVELSFALTSTTDANGKISIGIPVLGGVEAGGSGNVKAENVSSLLVELVPPKPIGIMSHADTSQFGITKAIIDTRSQLLEGLNQPPKLIPDKAVITLKFNITRTSGPTGQIKFLVFTVGGGLTQASANASSITLTFSKSKEP